MDRSPADLLLFLHIPKSAGTTVHHFLNMQFGMQSVLVSHWEGAAESVARIRGHTGSPKTPDPGGNWALSVWPPSSSWTPEHLHHYPCNPIDRLISYYYYVQAYPDTYIHATAAKLSLDDFITSEATIALDNLQVRLLAGRKAAPIGTLTSADTEQAKDNLRRHFSVVGVQDNVKGFLRALCRRFQLPSIRVSAQNKTHYRRSLAAIANSTKQTILERNALDLAIYNYVKDNLAPQTGWERLTKPFRPWARAAA